MTSEDQRNDQDLKDPVLGRLGEGAELAPARRAALLERIAPAQAGASRRRARIIRLSWGALAAAAAILVAAVVLWPERREPISPTELFADLFGPLPQIATAGATTTAPAQEESSPFGAVLSAFWGDLEGPLTIAVNAIEAPRALASVEPAGRMTPANPDSGKEN